MTVVFRTQDMLLPNVEMQVEEAKSVGEQLSRDLEFYADLGTAARPPSFRSLGRFWLGLMGVTCAGMAALEIMGPLPRQDLASGTARAPDVEVPQAAAASSPPVASFYRGAALVRPEAASAPQPVKAVAPPLRFPNQDPPPSELPSPVSGAAMGASAVPRPLGTVREALQTFKPAVPPTVPTIPEPGMITLPGGVLRMGSNDDPSERPVHSVLVEPFLMARTAVTVREWQACVDAKGCTLQPKGRPDQPVGNLSWDDASQYADWLAVATGKHYRLPTEAEWEFAARAGTETRYPWGNAMTPGKTSCKNCGKQVSVQNPPAVDAFPPNPFGLFGMGGGVAEWVADCWHPSYQDAPRIGTDAWDGPDCRERVLRGGSWVADAKYLRSSSRDSYAASVRYPTHGLRLARSE